MTAAPDVDRVLRELVDELPDVLFVLDAASLRATYVNRAFERVFGRPRAALEASPHAWLDSVHEDDRAPVREQLERRRPGAAPEPLGEFRIVDAQRRVRWMEGRVRRLGAAGEQGAQGAQGAKDAEDAADAADADGAGRPWVESLHDVTEARAAGLRARRDRQRDARLVEMLGALVVETDAEGRIVRWNEAVSALSGKTLERADAGHVMELLEPGAPYGVGLAEAIAALHGDRRHQVGLRPLKAPNGQVRDIDWSVAPLRDDPGGELYGFLWLGRDVTAERRSLRTSDRRFAHLLHNLPDVPWLYSVDAREYEYIGPGFEALWGRPAPAGPAGAELLMTWVHPDDRADVEAALRQATRDPGGTPREVDYRVPHPNGAVRWLHSRALPIFGEHDDHGERRAPTHVAGFTIDVTAHHATLRALRASEELVRSISEAMHEVFFLVDRNRTTVSYVNPAIERVWGISVEQLTANPGSLLAAVHPEDRARVAQAIADSIARPGPPTPIDIEFRVVRPDGAVRWIESRAYPLLEPDGTTQRIVGLQADVTERKETALALGEREELLRQMSEAMREAFFLVSVDRSKVHYVNPAFEQLWGLMAAEVQADPGLMLASIHPDDRERVVSELARAGAAPGEPRAESRELRIVRPDGSVRWIHARTYPVRAADGRVERIVGLDTDITERKAIERALQERTAQLELSLREKNVLLAEVHHRVKNNLQAITGLMHLMAAQAHRRPLRETIEELERRIQAMALVHETLYRSTSLTAVDMKDYLERIVEAVVSAGDAGRGNVSVAVRAAVTMDLGRAMRCGLIVNELVNNAVKHAFTRRARGRIEVDLRDRGAEGYALRVSDDGRGFPADLSFESEATLGLRLVAGLAQQIGGTVRRVPGERSAIEIVFAAEG